MGRQPGERDAAPRADDGARGLPAGGRGRHASLRALSAERAGEIARAWEPLDREATSFLQASDWAAIVARHLPVAEAGGALHCFEAGADGRRLAAALLCRDSVKLGFGLPATRLTALTQHDILFADGLLAAEADPRQVAALLQRARFDDGSGWDFLELRRLRPSSALFRLACLLPAARCEPEADGGAAVIDVARGYGDWEAALAPRLRAELRRARRRLDEQGAWRCRMLDAPDDVAAGFDAFVQLEDAGWKRGRGALAGDPAARAMLRELLVAFARSGRAGVHRLMLGERPIGSHLWLRVGGTLFALKTAYAEDAAQLAPGKLMLADLVRHCEDARIARIDFLAASDWLQRWGARHEPTYTVTAFNGRSLVGTAGRARRALGRLAAHFGAAGTGAPAPHG